MEKMSKNKKLSKRKKLEKECLDLWSLCVRERDGYICRICGTEHIDRATVMSGHHIRTKKNHPITRYMTQNGLCLCFRCHSLEKFNHEAFMDEIIRVIGQDEYDRLKNISNKEIKYSIIDLEMIKRQLETELKHIRSGLNFNDIPF